MTKLALRAVHEFPDRMSPSLWWAPGMRGADMRRVHMDYVTEAKKFIQLAVDAHNADVIKENLRMADWCLGQEIEERDEPATPMDPPKSA
ncbi:MAG: hypothetical protein R3D01_00290 [Hyphomicrobiales bacterium]